MGTDTNWMLIPLSPVLQWGHEAFPKCREFPLSMLVCFQTCLKNISCRSLGFPGKLSHHASCWEVSVQIRRQQRLSPSGVSDLVRAHDWQLLKGVTRYFTSVWCPDCYPFLPTLAIVILPISRNPTAANANVRPLWSYSATQHTLHKKWEVDQGHCIGNATSPKYVHYPRPNILDK